MKIEFEKETWFAFAQEGKIRTGKLGAGSWIEADGIEGLRRFESEEAMKAGVESMKASDPSLEEEAFPMF